MNMHASVVNGKPAQLVPPKANKPTTHIQAAMQMNCNKLAKKNIQGALPTDQAIQEYMRAQLSKPSGTTHGVTPARMARFIAFYTSSSNDGAEALGDVAMGLEDMLAAKLKQLEGMEAQVEAREEVLDDMWDALAVCSIQGRTAAEGMR